MVLALKIRHGSLEQNRQPRNKPKHIWAVYLRQRSQEYTMGHGKSLQSCLTLLRPHGCTSGSSDHEFSRQEYWSGCQALLQGIFPTQGSNSHLFMSPALPGGFFTASATWEAPHNGRQPFQQTVLEKLDSHMQKNETEPLSYTTQKNELKILKIWMYDLNHKTQKKIQAASSLTSVLRMTEFDQKVNVSKAKNKQ